MVRKPAADVIPSGMHTFAELHRPIELPAPLWI
jgi:hypothetical protein